MIHAHALAITASITILLFVAGYTGHYLTHNRAKIIAALMKRPQP